MSGTQLVIMAVTMGLMCWIARGMIGGYFAFFFITSPIVIEVVVGLTYGDLTKRLAISGGIATAFVGIIASGGNLPTDSALTATTVIPIALVTGLTVEQAIAFAVPMGLLDSFVTNLRKMINVIFVHRANKSAAKGSLSGITRCAMVYPPLIKVSLLFPPIFLIVMFEQDAILAFMNSVPNWVVHGLEVVGGVMSTIGFALIINMIEKPKMTPYTVLGFVVIKAVGLNTPTANPVAGCVAVLVVLGKREREKESA